MKTRDFTIIFKKLEEARSQEPQTAERAHKTIPEASTEEIDEIAELRRIVLETTDPGRSSYTST